MLRLEAVLFFAAFLAAPFFESSVRAIVDDLSTRFGISSSSSRLKKSGSSEGVSGVAGRFSIDSKQGKASMSSTFSFPSSRYTFSVVLLGYISLRDGGSATIRSETASEVSLCGASLFTAETSDGEGGWMISSCKRTPNARKISKRYFRHYV